ncbi:hypothetical protein CcaCcLH18_07902 [Colletotrichum camelliae]|nr:hypothetical protein CcaCcLH18_07902 [Colletotrichum camelliae]
MLPPSLASTYREYKRDTDLLASWLALTAQSHGYKGDLASSGYPARDGSKAETQTTKGDDTGKGVDEGRPSRYKVAIRNFVPLAESIASMKPATRTPPSIVNTINRVIAARSDFAAKVKDFSGLDAHVVKAHAHFVGIIEKVQDILVPKDVSTPQQSVASSDEEISNFFAALELEDPSAEFLNAPDVEKPTPKAAPAAPASRILKYEAETSDELNSLDGIIIFALMASDLALVRAVIIDTWGKNARGELTLSAAALTTSAAIDLANHAIKDVLPILEAHGGVLEVAQQFVAMLCAKNGLDSETLGYSQGTTRMSEGMYAAYDRSLLCVYATLDSCLKSIKAGKDLEIPVFSGPKSFDWVMKRRGRRLSGSQRFEQDQDAVIRLVSNYLIISNHVQKSEWPVEDEILRGIREMKATGSVPFCLVLAAQVHVDIQQHLGVLVMNPSQEMVKELDSMKTELDHQMSRKTDIERALGVSTQSGMWPIERDSIARDMIEMMDKLLKDPCHQAKLRISGTPPQQVAELSFFRESPCMSGLVVAYCRNYMKQAGIDRANFWATFVNAAHVHNAVKQSVTGRFSIPLLERPWRDLEIALSRAGLESQLFTGPPPTAGKDFYRKYSLQLGFSAVNFTNLHKKKAGNASTDPAGTRISSQAEKRLIQHDRVAPTFTSLVSKYTYDGPTLEWTGLLVRSIAESIEGQGEAGFDNHGANHFKKIASKVQGKEEANPQSSAQNKPKPNEDDDTHGQSRLDAWNIAKQLRMALQEESVEFEFPYLEFHRSAGSAMDVIKDTIMEALKYSPSPPGLADEDIEMQLAVQLLFKSCDRDAKEYDGGFTMRCVANDINFLTKTRGNPVEDYLSQKGLN